MKIAVFIKSTTHSKNFSGGGLEIQNKLLCEGLVQRGNEVIVYSPQFSELKNTENQVDNLDIIENGVIYKFINAKYENKTISSGSFKK